MRPLGFAAAAALILLFLGLPLTAALIVTVATSPAQGELVTTTCASASSIDPNGSKEGQHSRPSTQDARKTAGLETVTPGRRRPSGAQEGGVGFQLPRPSQPRHLSEHTPASPIPHRVQSFYLAAAHRYQLPWTLLAGIGMEETNHGRTNGTTSAGATGLMQFLPSTWTRYGVDGDANGSADIHDPADSVMSAANFLTASGVTNGAGGVRRALFAYNHAEAYVNDVLAYADAYGGGTVEGAVADCGDGPGDPSLPPITSARAAGLLTWARDQLGEPYVFGASGPSAWDCSSFTRGAYSQIGISLPRTAQAQRDWLAHGNGYRVTSTQAAPGDLVFTDTYRGPNAIGHVMLVLDPARGTSIEAVGAKVQIDRYSRYAVHPIYEIWRVGNLIDPQTRPGPGGSVHPRGSE